MSTTIQFPNGQALVSDALTVDGMNDIFVPLTLAAIGDTAILTAAPHSGAIGANYAVNDQITVVQAGAENGILVVGSVNGSGGVLSLAPGSPNNASGYVAATGLSTTGGSGTGLEVDILTVGPSSTSNLVRTEWPTDGAPFADVSDDVCYLGCVTSGDDDYAKIRDRVWTQNSDPQNSVTENWGYTRIWQVTWTMYGPNSWDNARAIKSAMFLDYFTNSLGSENLFPVSDFTQPRRVPELINGQWFERVDYEIEVYEFVKETITDSSVLSVEVKVNNSAGQIADFTVTA